MGNRLYLECGSGISGDMTVAALLDLGVKEEVLRNALSSLPVDGYEIEISRVKKSGLDVCDFNVKLDHAHENHDHDMEYLHGTTDPEPDILQEAVHGHTHPHEHPGHSHDHAAAGHTHGQDDHAVSHNHDHVETGHTRGQDDHAASHSHEHAEGGHMHGQDDHAASHSHEHAEGGHTHGQDSHAASRSHEHRGLPEIQAIIRQAEITDRAKATALRVFEILAEAEAKAHGVPLEQVHFHEVGAVDSIVDIVAAAVCLDALDVTEVIVPELCEGRGFIRCQHGVIPVPVPAVLNIVQAHGLTLHPSNIEGELVTPTGAAIVAACKTSGRLPEKYQISRVGIGAGKRNYERPSLLRAMLLAPDEQEGQETPAGLSQIPAEASYDTKDTIFRLESNIDDCAGEALGHCMDRLLKAGARDVYYTPIYMKKNRPAVQLNVICKKEQITELEQIIFEETTTIGIRRMELERTVLPRKKQTIGTAYGPAEIKVCTLPNGEVRAYPEFDSVKALADRNQLSFPAAFSAVKRAADEILQGGIFDK